MALALLTTTGCSDSESDDDSSSDAIKLDQAPIPTQLKELKAGLPYVPGIDTLPRGADCITNPKVVIAAGNVVSSGGLVRSRDVMNVELGLDVSGTIPILGVPAAGAASLTSKITFDQQSAVVLFQTTGTYESVLTSNDTPAFDIARVGKCGFGYIQRAFHRVSAALVVQMRATSNGTDVKGNASLGKQDVASAKANVGTIIQKGNVEISIRVAADVIPDLPDAPVADAILQVGDSDADKQLALTKIENAVKWIASSQTAVNKYINNLKTQAPDANPGVPPAPTERVLFQYYTDTPPEVRAAIQLASTNAIATRKGLGDATTMIEAWEQFGAAAKDGHGFEWNIPTQPVDTVEKLTSKQSELLDEGKGKLRAYESTLSDNLDACSLALKNEQAVSANPDLVARLAKACVPPPASPVDKKAVDIRRISFVSSAETDNGASSRCPSGLRLPTIDEAKIFAPWSHSLKANNEGLWLEKSNCVLGSTWLFDGSSQCAGKNPLSSTKGVSVCISKSGPIPDGT